MAKISMTDNPAGSPESTGLSSFLKNLKYFRQGIEEVKAVGDSLGIKFPGQQATVEPDKPPPQQPQQPTQADIKGIVAQLDAQKAQDRQRKIEVFLKLFGGVKIGELLDEMKPKTLKEVYEEIIKNVS